MERANALNVLLDKWLGPPLVDELHYRGIEFGGHLTADERHLLDVEGHETKHAVGARIENRDGGGPPVRIPTKSPGCTDMKSPGDSETMSPTSPI